MQQRVALSSLSLSLPLAAAGAAAICVAHVARRGAKFSGKDKARRGKKAPKDSPFVPFRVVPWQFLVHLQHITKRRNEGTSQRQS